ncbi:serine/threonine protein kinase [Motiliproteus coralliicola]|uniref:Stress response kinase A n=1 Tax=Motiliproteus coralliicola TaxID=2283196 RepID=A0A369WTT5_9GAMM|nr:serine/threonine protein kinase [Motiliproteus coralliicola]RDE25092.1 serine/threonine protein kinase [Motiliproteus coralliicola]
MSLDSQHPYDALSPDAVIDAVESAGFWSDARVFALNSYENRVYQVGIEEGEPLIAKFYRPERWSEAQILEEHRFTQALADNHIPVIAPIRDDNGNSLFEHGGFQFALFARRGGHAPELDNLDNLYVLGRTLGRIHLQGSATSFEHRPALDTQTFGHASREFLLNNNWLPKHYASDYQHLTAELLALIEQRFADIDQLRLIRLHGDCHPGNILWRDEAPHFVDFDDCRSGPAIQDLWMLISGDQQQQRLQMSEIIEGYEEFQPFDRRELALIEPLRALRIMHYSAWLARRWQDPAFPLHFPWFNTESYWMEHLMELTELRSTIQAEPLQLGG